MPIQLRSTHWPTTGAARAAHAAIVVNIALLTAAALIVTSGCATFGKRGREAEAAAVSRELLRQGSVAMQKGKWDEAEKLSRQALDETPEDGKVRRQLAETLWRRGAANEAMSHMAAAVRLEPKNAEYLVRAGEMALASGAKEAALSHADQAIRNDPKLASAWALRGRALRQLNQRDRAMADLQRALVLAPNSPDLLWELAILYREGGQHVRCLTTLHHLHDTYSPGEEPQSALLLEGLTLMELNRPHQATEVLAAAVTRGPADANLLYTLAQAQSAAGRVADATSTAQQALAVDRSHQPSRQLLAQLAAQTTPSETQRR